MSILSALILGLIQGACEFIPVSSSAHICLFEAVTGYGPQLPGLDAVLHAGTLFAVLFAYRRELPGLFRACASLPRRIAGKNQLSRDERTVLFSLLCVVPVVVAAVCGGSELSDRVSSSPVAVGALLILNGAILLTGDSAKNGTLIAEDTRFYHALGVGLFQAVAVLPGISRSGATVTGGLLLGIRRDEAVRLSFICSVPAILGACVLKLPAAFRYADAGTVPAYLCGAAAAALSGFAAVKLIKTIGEKPTFKYFSIYCFAAGICAVLYGIRG